MKPYTTCNIYCMRQIGLLLVLQVYILYACIKHIVFNILGYTFMPLWFFVITHNTHYVYFQERCTLSTGCKYTSKRVRI